MMRIFIENLQFHGLHGVYEIERTEGTRFRVDLAVIVDRWAAGDEIDQTLDYRCLAEIVLEVANGESVHLIETLGHRIVDRIFDAHNVVTAVDLTIRKKADVAGDPEWVGATFELDRERWEATSGNGA